MTFKVIWSSIESHSQNIYQFLPLYYKLLLLVIYEASISCTLMLPIFKL